MTISLPSSLRGYIRAAAESLMTDTCTLSRQKDAAGDYGEIVSAYEVMATGVACRLITIGNRFSGAAGQPGQRAGGQAEMVPMGRETLTDTYRLVLPAGTTIDVDYRATMSSGDVYEVVDLVTERTDEADVLAIVTRVR